MATMAPVFVLLLLTTDSLLPEAGVSTAVVVVATGSRTILSLTTGVVEVTVVGSVATAGSLSTYSFLSSSVSELIVGMKTNGTIKEGRNEPLWKYSSEMIVSGE